MKNGFGDRNSDTNITVRNNFHFLRCEYFLPPHTYSVFRFASATPPEPRLPPHRRATVSDPLLQACRHRRTTHPFRKNLQHQILEKRPREKRRDRHVFHKWPREKCCEKPCFSHMAREKCREKPRFSHMAREKCREKWEVRPCKPLPKRSVKNAVRNDREKNK